MTAPSAAPAAPHRSLRRLHRPALLGWTAFVLLVAGLLLWLYFSEVPAERACQGFHFSASGQLPACGYSALTDAENVFNFLGETLSYRTLAQCSTLQGGGEGHPALSGPEAAATGLGSPHPMTESSDLPPDGRKVTPVEAPVRPISPESGKGR
ncbi:hypothetical protein [Streptomyces shenzhenensis]|uniref:hypothetical protein n=1 Tax=Streptomyces shenzhenensis TaxID=943815 RepID=UPI001F1A566B|nr:hypothetical protein [Streptomyces shenzhenensis]